MQKIVIATKNKGKVKEMAAALSKLPADVASLADFGDLPDAVEDGKTFAENARSKALFYQQQTGCACIADDSGLEIEALDGAPGIYSARFAGTHADDAANNAKMAAELKKKGVRESAADYRCAIVFAGMDGTLLEADGRCDGWVKLSPKGTGGFGYDPYFYPQAYPGRTMAELTLEEKQQISHRGKALADLFAKLEDYLK